MSHRFAVGRALTGFSIPGNASGSHYQQLRYAGGLP
jgi:hypothetical protein